MIAAVQLNKTRPKFYMIYAEQTISRVGSTEPISYAAYQLITQPWCNLRYRCTIQDNTFTYS